MKYPYFLETNNYLQSINRVQYSSMLKYSLYAVNSILNRESDTTKILSQGRFFLLESYGRSPSIVYRVHWWKVHT